MHVRPAKFVGQSRQLSTQKSAGADGADTGVFLMAGKPGQRIVEETASANDFDVAVAEPIGQLVVSAIIDKMGKQGGLVLLTGVDRYLDEIGVLGKGGTFLVNGQEP